MPFLGWTLREQFNSRGSDRTDCPLQPRAQIDLNHIVDNWPPLLTAAGPYIDHFYDVAKPFLIVAASMGPAGS